MQSIIFSKKSHLFQPQYVNRLIFLDYIWNNLQNAFHTTFADSGFNTFMLFVVDLMHEVELGVFKDFLIYLLRLLFACGPATIAEFDCQ